MLILWGSGYTGRTGGGYHTDAVNFAGRVWYFDTASAGLRLLPPRVRIAVFELQPEAGLVTHENTLSPR